MTKKELSKRKKQCRDIIVKYQEELSLNGWDIHFAVIDRVEPMSAEIKVDHIYQWASISIYSNAFTGLNNIDHILCHELCHCLTEPLYIYCVDMINNKVRTHDDVNEQREMLTEKICKLIRD